MESTTRQGNLNMTINLTARTRIYLLCIFAALIGSNKDVEALQPDAYCRRAFVGNLATMGAGAVAASASFPASAIAADDPRKRRSKTLRGGKDVSDATHNGTDLNEKETGVAGGLLGKMGLQDITPDKGASAKRSYSGNPVPAK